MYATTIDETEIFRKIIYEEKVQHTDELMPTKSQHRMQPNIWNGGHRDIKYNAKLEGSWKGPNSKLLP